tara:strand:- start:533 stop:889 length:357 start_codon:yes stop_codon:yes gene_type:complete
MKKLLGLFALVAILSVAVVPMAVSAIETPTNGLPTTGIPTTGATLISRIGLIGNWVFAIFLALSVIYIVLAAFQFVTGGGNPEQVSGARQKLLYAVVGIAIALLAAGFDDILRNILTG